jgi:hypothetical protein
MSFEEIGLELEDWKFDSTFLQGINSNQQQQQQQQTSVARFSVLFDWSRLMEKVTRHSQIR